MIYYNYRVLLKIPLKPGAAHVLIGTALVVVVVSLNKETDR